MFWNALGFFKEFPKLTFSVLVKFENKLEIVISEFILQIYTFIRIYLIDNCLQIMYNTRSCTEMQ